MRSMTGYGYGIYKDENYVLEVEMKSYNSRYLEIQHNISYTLSQYENYIDSQIKNVAKRGHIDLSVRLKVLEASVSVNVDRAALKEYMDAFSVIEEETGKSPLFSDYLGSDGVLTLVKSDDAEVYKRGLDSALSDALVMLDKAKEREGKGTYEDLLEYYPFKYIDRRHIYKISELTPDAASVQICARLLSCEMFDMGFHRARLVAHVSDGSGIADLVWFKKAEHIAKHLKAGTQYIVFGSPTVFNGRYQFAHPELKPISEVELSQLGLQPYYNTSDKMTIS